MVNKSGQADAEDKVEYERAISAGVDALNLFDPTDWMDKWVSSEEIVRAIFDALREHDQRLPLDASKMGDGCKNPTKGYRARNKGFVKILATLDDETFKQVRALALAENTSLTEQIRRLVERGLLRKNV